MTTPIPHPADISVTLPVTQALDLVKRVLFQPFDLAKWFVIGFCAWLAMLGQGGSGVFNFNFPSNRRGSGNLSDALEEAWQFVVNNLHWLLPVVIAGLLLGLILWVLFAWLSSRGQFMFLYCVALDTAEVRVPWHRFATQGNSLFEFRLALGLVGLLLVLPALVCLILLIVGMVKHGAVATGAILGAIALGLFLLAAALVFGLIHKLLLDFVVPIMFLRGGRCLAAGREFLALFLANFWRFALYVLFQIVLGMVIAVALLALVIITCCCAGCLMALPYLGTVVLLPVLVFSRAYSVHYLAQYGPAYDVFAADLLPAGNPPPRA